jgi:DNA gyrase/topoisomerase IV subunit A
VVLPNREQTKGTDIYPWRSASQSARRKCCRSHLYEIKSPPPAARRSTDRHRSQSCAASLSADNARAVAELQWARLTEDTRPHIAQEIEELEAEIRALED